MSKLDTSIKEIEELLKQRSIKIDTMMNTTASSREKLKLINQKMNIEEEKLLTLIIEAADRAVVPAIKCSISFFCLTLLNLLLRILHKSNI